MSGGAFDYRQYYIDDIADHIEDIIRKNKVEKSKEDLECWDKKMPIGDSLETIRIIAIFDNYK